jgi:hypothetical protein
MKYILRLCGSKLEKCDFSNLLSVNKTEEIVQIIKYLNHNNKNISTKTQNTTNSSAPIVPSIPKVGDNFLKKKNLRSEYNFKQSKKSFLVRNRPGFCQC